MNHTFFVLLHEVLCAALFYGAFCRAIHANKQTKYSMHIIIRLTGAVATLGMLAPISWNYQPDWFAMILLTLSVTAQFLASSNWREGIPEIFQRKHHNVEAD